METAITPYINGYAPWIPNPTTFYSPTWPNQTAPAGRIAMTATVPFGALSSFVPPLATTTGGIQYIYGQGWHTTYCLDFDLTGTTTAPGRSYTIGGTLADYMSPSLPGGCNLICSDASSSFFFSNCLNVALNPIEEWMDLAVTTPLAMRYPVQGIAGATSSITNQMTQLWSDGNFTYDHIDSYVRHIAFIYDETANPTSTPNNPIIFPINNSADSAMTSLMTNPTLPYVPQIGHVFLPFSNPDGRLYAAGWPTPCNQITLNAPHNGVTWQSDAGQPLSSGYNLGNSSTIITCGGLGQTNAKLLVPTGLNIMGPPAYMDGPHSQYDGAAGAQSVFGTFDFPKNWSMYCGTRELFYSPPTIVPQTIRSTDWMNTQSVTAAYTIPISDSVYASPTLLERPSGVTTEPRYVYSGRPAFIWDISQPANPTLVERQVTITIPPGSYTTEALIYQINKVLSDAGGLTSEVDFQSASYLCVASDLIDDTASWRVTANNTLPSNMSGPSSAGHVGRGVHAFAGPNCVVKVGSSIFGFAQNGSNQFTISGTTELYCPTPLASSALSATPSCFFLPYSYSRCPWDPPLVGDYGYKDISGNNTVVDPQFLAEAVTYDGILMGDNSVETSYQNVNCSVYNTGSLDLFCLVAITSASVPATTTTGTQVTGPFDSGNLSYQLVSIWSSTATNLTGSFNLMNYASQTKFSNTMGAQIQNRLNANIYLNPWGSAVVNGPTGVVITRLHDGTPQQQAFWASLGFSADQYNKGFVPDIGYVRPIEGLMYMPDTKTTAGQYTNTPDQFCISNQSPYLFRSMSPAYYNALVARYNGDATAALASLPTYPVTLVAATPVGGNYSSFPDWFVANDAPPPTAITAVTNCPMFCVEPLKVSPYRKEPVTGALPSTDPNSTPNLIMVPCGSRFVGDPLAGAIYTVAEAFDYEELGWSGTWLKHDIGKNMYALQGTLPSSFQPFWTPQPLINRLTQDWPLNGPANNFAMLNTYVDTAVGYNSSLGCRTYGAISVSGFYPYTVEFKYNTSISVTTPPITLPNVSRIDQQIQSMDIFNNQRVVRGTLLGCLTGSCFANTLRTGGADVTPEANSLFQTSGLSFGYPTCEPIANRTWNPSNQFANIITSDVNYNYCSFSATLNAGDATYLFHNLPSANAGWSACLREKWVLEYTDNLVPEVAYPNDVLANVVDQCLCVIPLYIGDTMTRRSPGNDYQVYDRSCVLPYRGNWENYNYDNKFAVWPPDAFTTAGYTTNWQLNWSSMYDCLAQYSPANKVNAAAVGSALLCPNAVTTPLPGCGASFMQPFVTGNFIEPFDVDYFQRIWGSTFDPVQYPTWYTTTAGVDGTPVTWGAYWNYPGSDIGDYSKSQRSSLGVTPGFQWQTSANTSTIICWNMSVAGLNIPTLSAQAAGSLSCNSVQSIIGNMGPRFPRQGRVHCDQITPGYLNVAPCLTDRGFSGLPTIPEIQNAATSGFYNWQAEITRLQTFTDVIPHIKNYSLNDPLSLTFRFSNAQRFTPTSYITRPSLAFNRVITPMSVVDYSGTDMSEPLQQENPVGVALVASIPYIGASKIQDAGYILLRLTGLDIISDNTTYVVGNYNRNVFVCPIQAGLTNTQVVAFNTPLDLNVCAQSISTLSFEILGPTGANLTGVSSARIFVNFTPTGQPTFAETAFAMGESPGSASAQAPPSGYESSGPTLSAPIPSASSTSPPAKRSNNTYKPKDILPGARPGVAPRFHPSSFAS